MASEGLPEAVLVGVVARRTVADDRGDPLYLGAAHWVERAANWEVASRIMMLEAEFDASPERVWQLWGEPFSQTRRRF